MNQPQTHPAASAAAAFVVTLLLSAFVWVVYRTAWMSDDGYITLRVIDNFVNGYGLRWNVAERVQVYTHPLWMFLLTPVYFFTREGFLTPVYFSIAVSAVAAALFAFGVARHPLSALLGLLTFLFSRAYIDYATSGLENPLTHLLLAGFIGLFFFAPATPRTTFALVLLAALGALNRLDTGLLYAPALLYLFFSRFGLRTAAACALGFLPLVLWLAFATVYYGFPFPNTAYAKIGTGIGGIETAQQGAWYLVNSLREDPITLATIVLAAFYAGGRREWRMIMLMLGVLLYLAYIVRIGGDFMTGRFLTAPLFVAVAVLAQWRPTGRTLATVPTAFAAIVALGFSSPHPPIMTGPDFGQARPGSWKDAHGIGDERMFYFPVASLARYQKDIPWPAHPYAQKGRQYRREEARGPVVHGAVGFRGYFGGPTIHIIDYYALADPLLARLPARYQQNWRIGHFTRRMPPGYQQAALGAPTALAEPGLAEFYAALRTVTRGPLFSGERWAAMRALNAGELDHLIPYLDYRFPGVPRVEAAAVSRPFPPGTKWDAPGTTRLEQSGLHIAFADTRHARTLEVSLDNNDEYRLYILRAGRDVADYWAGPSTAGLGGLAVYRIDLPAEIADAGYDAVIIKPKWIEGGYNNFSLGHLRLLNASAPSGG